MSSSSFKVFLSLQWLCLLVILCINTPSCQGVQKLCGKKLPDTLSLICENGFGTKTKKSIDPIDYYSDMDDDLLSDLDRFPFLSRFEGGAGSLAKTRRRRFGIADECCKKPCTMSELRSYCL